MSFWSCCFEMWFSGRLHEGAGQGPAAGTACHREGVLPLLFAIFTNIEPEIQVHISPRRATLPRRQKKRSKLQAQIHSSAFLSFSPGSQVACVFFAPKPQEDATKTSHEPVLRKIDQCSCFILSQLSRHDESARSRRFLGMRRQAQGRHLV